MNLGWTTYVGGYLSLDIDGNLSISGDVDMDDLSLSGDITLEGGGAVDTTLNGDIKLEPNGTGKVGVGAAAPKYLFSVDGRIGVQGSNHDLLLDGGASYVSIVGYGDGGFGAIWLRGSASPPGGCWIEPVNGYLGCGESNPTAPLSVGSGNLFQVDSSGDVTFAGGGSIKTTSDGDISLEPNGSGIIETTAPIRGATSLWYSYRQLSFTALSPGGSGATFTAPNANTIGGYQLNAAGEYLYADVDIHDNWDQASDIEVTVYFEINAAGAAGTDTVDLQLLAYIKGVGDTATKLQTLENAVTVGTAAQYTSFSTTFLIDYDDGSNPVDVEDLITIRLNLETDTSEVDDVIINHIEVRYKTKQIGIEV